MQKAIKKEIATTLLKSFFYSVSTFVVIYISVAIYTGKSISQLISEDLKAPYLDLLQVVLFFLIFLIFLVVKKYYKLRQDYIVEALHLGSVATNKSLMTVTENISHELSTPLEVIQFKFYNIMKVISSVEDKMCNSECGTCPNSTKYVNGIEKTKRDYHYIEISVEQISNILHKMKGFKSVKYSNGNKTLFDIFETAFNIMSISHQHFTWDIDVELKGYNLSKEGCMPNADFLNILINHIKNSLEASTTHMSASFVNFDGEFVYLYLSDNGNGIPEEIIPFIFKPNISSKTSILENRGNGMFINMEILKSHKGNVKLVNTSKEGTIFEIKLLANKKQISS